MFSELATLYLFLGGVGGGSLAVLCLLEIAQSGRAGRTDFARAVVLAGGGTAGECGFDPRRAAGASRPRMRDAFAALPREPVERAWPVCFVALAFAIGCLLVDLGRPDRVIAVVLSPYPTPVAIGAWALGIGFVVAAAFSAVALFDGVPVRTAVVRVVSCAGIAAGAVIVAYTGVLLQTMASVLVWQTPLVPVAFSLSSLSCGVTVVLVGMAFATTRQAFGCDLALLVRADTCLIVAEAVVLAAYVAWAFSSAGTQPAAYALMAGGLAWPFWGGVVTVGLAAPLALEQAVRFGNRQSQLVWIAACVLAGAFALRFCVAGMGLYDVTQCAEALYGLAL